MEYSMSKKKIEKTIHNSAAEYLTYGAAVGDNADSIKMLFKKMDVADNYHFVELKN